MHMSCMWMYMPVSGECSVCACMYHMCINVYLFTCMYLVHMQYYASVLQTEQFITTTLAIVQQSLNKHSFDNLLAITYYYPVTFIFLVFLHHISQLLHIIRHHYYVITSLQCH